jgi:hypothetical protein
MLLRSRHPRTVFRAAMACLLVSLTLPWIVHPTTALWTDVVDGVRGVLLGATLALVALSGALTRRGGRGGRGGPSPTVGGNAEIAP